MLIRFVITNFRSYGLETEFNMLPSQNVRRNDWHVHSDAPGVPVLRTAVIYGANGAGKSCLVRAIGRLQTMVIHGFLPPVASRDANKYAGAKEPVTLEIEFKTGKGQYSYGVSYRGNICVEEWLYSTKRTPKCIFERKRDNVTGKTKITLLPTKKEDAKNKMLVSLLEENILKSNELLLSKYDVVKEAQMKDAYLWIVSQLHVIYPETHSTSIFDNRYTNPTFKQQSEKLIAALDLGIDELMLKDEDLESFKLSISEWPELVQGVEKIVRRLSKAQDDSMEAMVEASTFTISIRREGDKYYVRRVKSVHRVSANNYDFELKEESDGTQRIFDFLPVMQEVKGMTSTYIIDELDRSLHPSLVRALVKRVVTDKKMKGQLIFTTHDAGLLDGEIFRNDEIWFAEKDRETQNSHLYTLDEFKPRTDLNLEKGYLNGRFGAIPFLAKLNELDWE
ncbi:AAA family ATPase [Bacteroides sp. KG68]|uniref:AAA family ATPase n=1 Tax=unclassified Bacteroides TaxID=2646097 RepID=UPI003D98E18D